MTNTECSCYSSCASQWEISFLLETNDLSPLFLITVIAVFIIDDLDRSIMSDRQVPGKGLVNKTGNRWFGLGGPVESTPPAPFSRGHFWEQFCITAEDWGVWLKDSKNKKLSIFCFSETNKHIWFLQFTMTLKQSYYSSFLVTKRKTHIPSF